MLKVSEILAALAAVSGDLTVYLPGGCPVRSVEVREGEGVFLTGDSELRGSPEERAKVAEIKGRLIEGGIAANDPGHLDKLAWDLLEMGQGRDEQNSARHAPPPPPDADGYDPTQDRATGDVTITPETGSMNAAGVSVGAGKKG